MWKHLKDDWDFLKSHPPGRRLQQFYDYRHQKRERGESYGPVPVILAAIVVLLLGASAIFLPGPQGSILIPLGLALLGSEVRPIARLGDRLECFLVHLKNSLAGWWRGLPAVARVLVVLILAGCGGAAAWGAWTAWAPATRGS